MTESSFGNQIFGLTYKNPNNLSGYGSLISYKLYGKSNCVCHKTFVLLFQENLVVEA